MIENIVVTTNYVTKANYSRYGIFYVTFVQAFLWLTHNPRGAAVAYTTAILEVSGSIPGLDQMFA